MHAGPAAVLARLLAVALLVGGTYNPSGYSWWHWTTEADGQWAGKVFAGLVLAIGYAVCVTATLRSLGWLLGAPLALTIAAGVWFGWDMGWIDLSDATRRVLAFQAALIAFLGTGTSFSLLRYRLAGQMDSRTLA
jgi:hypothetical protein